jgi:flagellin-specific chaperone FliS
MSITLTEANINDDIAKPNEVSRLLFEIKSAWVQIPQQDQQASV